MTTKPAGLPEVIHNIERLMKDHEAILQKLDTLLKREQDLSTVAAKIINDISKKIENCECNKEILEALKLKGKGKELSPTKDLKLTKQSFTGKYSFPNYEVGNEELGSSRGKNTLVIKGRK